MAALALLFWWWLPTRAPGRTGGGASIDEETADKEELVGAEVTELAPEESRAALVSVPPAPSPLEDHAESPDVARFRLIGTVLGSPSDEPIPGAEVRLGGHLIARSDEHGIVNEAVVVRRDAPVEVVELTTSRENPSVGFEIGAPGWSIAKPRIRGRCEGTLNLGVIRLEPGGEVTGLVIDDANVPVAGAWVSWRAGEEEPTSPEAREAGVGHDPAWKGAVPDTRADGAGRFRLTGVPVVPGFLIARGSTTTFGWTKPFALGRREPREFTIVVLRETGFHALIDGRVIDPSGAPVSRAKVVVHCGGERNECRSDDQGLFALDWYHPGLAFLSAADPEDRWAPAWIAGLDLSVAHGLVMQLKEDRISFVVKSSEGQPIARARASGSWTFINVDGGESTAGQMSEHFTDGAGLVEFGRPPGPLVVAFIAPGFRPANETIAPEEMREIPIPIVLSAAPHMRGRILHRGSPVVGAHVYFIPSNELSIRSQGIVTLNDENAFDLRAVAHAGGVETWLESRTDADGRFVVGATSTLGVTITIRGDGLPLTVLGPFFPPHPDERLIELEEAGAIEGRVLMPLGASTRDRVVAACSGYTLAWTVPVEADGRFRIEDLAPGDYQVRACQAPIASLVRFDPQGPIRTGPIEWDCRVVAGATTRFDLDLRGEGTCHWKGRISFPQRDSDFRRGVRIEREDPASNPKQVGSGSLDTEGRIEFSLSEPGRHQLRVVLDEDTRLVQELEIVPGENVWSIDLPRCTLFVPKGTKRIGLDGKERRYIRYDVSGESGWRTETFLDLRRAEREERILHAPAGAVRLLEASNASNDEMLSGDWAPFAETETKPGEKVELFR